MSSLTVVVPELADRVLERIDERELLELALHLGNIESPRGEEGEVGEAIYQWCVNAGFRPRRLGIFEDRFNVHAELPGTGRGPSLAFNSHMDTAYRRDDHLIYRRPDDPVLHCVWEEGEWLVGHPVVNDKGPMAAFMIACRALRDAGIRLGGSVYLTMVCGEIGQEPIDEFQGKAYLSKELGARYLVNHSPRPSFCLNAEATGFKKGWVEAGKAFYKITVYGARPSYTPYLRRPYPREAAPAIVKAAELIQAIERWAEDYERIHRLETPGGTVVPKVGIGAVRAGRPSMLLQNPELCSIYLDVRTCPGQDVAAIGNELRDLLRQVKADGEVDQFLDRNGYEARGIHPLSEALDAAHQSEFGTACELAEPEITSMWRDHNVYNESGIPALTYGPAVAAGEGSDFRVLKRDLIRSARVYALTALCLCGVSD